jgi:branched-subunit amino acid transport protein
MSEPALMAFAALALGAAVTYGWRALGVLVAGRIDPQGRVIAWVACVAYALLAALIARMILLPVGILAETPLWIRLAATAGALAVWLASGRRLMPAILVGVAALSILTWASGIDLGATDLPGSG